ncbi:MAG: PTS-dependent dihydroxyacetone kinase phosphotransferase subunit DhaM [Chloroflexi bacterium]|nr:PTS-dependent dihydroxyacetone kinase phosphotransferase subunit DhaM [Anaerolineaceae bacterium]NMD26501.1 PTS-dependent dihydroxyacetone kinase phosphotransferase subunit DhaM [Chloroflexota bacterium]HOG78094.1 dihydroxyacetone kinase phosphoryl donor subunit DhaM [Anaerolineaceae bacterium]
MVNILLVSHSHQLAQGVAELVRQMAPSDTVKIAVAAGIGDNNEELGTNAAEIMEKLIELQSPEGILVLMDLGSALLSTDMALEMLEDDQKANIRMCPAPFVEGAIAAGVQANMGANLEAVYREAMSALLAKQEQIAPGSITAAPPQAPALATDAADQSEFSVVVSNASGLHARPAAVFAKTISSYDAKVTVTNQSENKGPLHINGLIAVMLLAAKKGDTLKIQAEGSQKNEVLAALAELFRNNFGE